MAATWPTTSGKIFLAALRRKGWREEEVSFEKTYVTKGPMTVTLPFTRFYILRSKIAGDWGERFGLRPEEVRLK